jgi:hypothetical protein
MIGWVSLAALSMWIEMAANTPGGDEYAQTSGDIGHPSPLPLGPDHQSYAAPGEKFLAAAMMRLFISRKRQPIGLTSSRIRHIHLAKARHALSIILIMAWSRGQTTGCCAVSLLRGRGPCWKKVAGSTTQTSWAFSYLYAMLKSTRPTIAI